MNEFLLWFVRPIAEFLGTVALVLAVIAVAVIVMLGYALYIAMRQKYCAHDFSSVNRQWEPPIWRCRKCGFEKNMPLTESKIARPATGDTSK